MDHKLPTNLPTGTDISQVFLVYLGLVGDADKTALALNLDREAVVALAEREGWNDKVARLSLASKGDHGDWERTQNRALNFVQVHQLRRHVDLTLAHLSTLKPGEAMVSRDRDGNTRYSARVFTDLAAAMERVHVLSYMALGDTARERSERETKGGGDLSSKGGVHTAMIAALNKSTITAPTPADTLANEAQVVVEDIAKGLKSANPNPKPSA